MSEKRYLQANEFKTFLLQRHEEYKKSPQIQNTTIVSTMERGIKILLAMTKEEKVKPYHVEENHQLFTYIEVDTTKTSTEELNQLNGISTFLMNIEMKLGHPSRI